MFLVVKVVSDPIVMFLNLEQNITQKTKDPETQTSLKTRGEQRGSG
jgi:hypothetical protein